MESIIVIRSDPQIHTLSCLLGCDVALKNISAVARHLKCHHSTRSDFPVIKNPFDADLQGSKKIAKHVLNEMDSEIF